MYYILYLSITMQILVQCASVVGVLVELVMILVVFPMIGVELAEGNPYHWKIDQNHSQFYWDPKHSKWYTLY